MVTSRKSAKRPGWAEEPRRLCQTRSLRCTIGLITKALRCENKTGARKVVRSTFRHQGRQHHESTRRPHDDKVTHSLMTHSRGNKEGGATRRANFLATPDPLRVDDKIPCIHC